MVIGGATTRVGISASVGFVSAEGGGLRIGGGVSCCDTASWTAPRLRLARIRTDEHPITTAIIPTNPKPVGFIAKVGATIDWVEGVVMEFVVTEREVEACLEVVVVLIRLVLVLVLILVLTTGVHGTPAQGARDRVTLNPHRT